MFTRRRRLTATAAGEDTCYAETEQREACWFRNRRGSWCQEPANLASWIERRVDVEVRLPGTEAGEKRGTGRNERALSGHEGRVVEGGIEQTKRHVVRPSQHIEREPRKRGNSGRDTSAVSYTHLTLPTSDLV